MYNESVKNKYLDTLSGSDDFARCKRIFTYTEQKENLEQVDLFNLPNEEIAQAILEKSKIRKKRSFYDLMRCVKQYKRWALIENLLSEEGKFYLSEPTAYSDWFLEYNRALIFRTPEELVSTIELYLSDKSEFGMTTDEIFLGMLMICYQGFSIEETLSLTIDDNVKYAGDDIILFNENRATIVYPAFKSKLKKIIDCRKHVTISVYDSEIYDMGKFIVSYKDVGNTDIKKVKKLLTKRISVRFPKDVFFEVKDTTLMGRMYQIKSKETEPLKYKERPEIIEKIYGTSDVPNSKKEKAYMMYDRW